MKTDNEAIEELKQIAQEQKRKRTNFIQWLIIIILGFALLIISFVSQPISRQDIIKDKNLKETIMAIPLPTLNPLATKVNPK